MQRGENVKFLSYELNLLLRVTNRLLKVNNEKKTFCNIPGYIYTYICDYDLYKPIYVNNITATKQLFGVELYLQTEQRCRLT
jgi:hypothetical protein